MKSIPILNICIPCYNRAHHVVPYVESLLKITSDKFIISVRDNCSTDDTFKLLSKIHDERFFYHRCDKMVHSYENLTASLYSNNAQYVILNLDKDEITTDYLLDFIFYLEKIKPICGYLAFTDSSTKNKVFVYDKGIESALKVSYLGKHPTGYYFKSEEYNKLLQDSYFIEIFKSFPFPYEIICAHLSIIGQVMVYDYPVVIHETPSNAIVEKSHTYNSANFYGNFDKRLLEFEIYFKDICRLSISVKERELLLKNVFYKGLFLSTFGYKNSYKDESVIAHYNLQKKNISKIELIYIAIQFRRRFNNIIKNNSIKYSHNLLCTSYLKWVIHLIK